MKQNVKLIQIVSLSLATLLQSVCGLFIKLAGMEGGATPRCFLYYGIALLGFAIYAVVWQLLLEKMQLSVAYLSNGLLYVFAFIWATVIFKESISFAQIAGCIVILTGIAVSQYADQ